MAMFKILPNVCSRESSAADTISFWISSIKSATTASNANEAAKATVVTVLTVDVVTVEIIPPTPRRRYALTYLTNNVAEDQVKVNKHYARFH